MRKVCSILGCTKDAGHNALDGHILRRPYREPRAMNGDIHTFPLNDVIDHETSGQPCPCGPEIKPVLGRVWPDEPPRQVGRQIIHHSLDGREQSE